LTPQIIGANLLIRQPNLTLIEQFHGIFAHRIAYEVVVLGVLLIASVVTDGFRQFSFSSGITGQAVADKSVGFINQNLLQGQAAASVKTVETEGDLYKIKLLINAGCTDIIIGIQGCERTNLEIFKRAQKDEYTLKCAKILHKYKLGKQIRTDTAFKSLHTEGGPIAAKLHQAKEGTPTRGGVVMWTTVAILTIGFWLPALYFDGFWTRMNFFSRSQTWLPLGVMIFGALLGALDDYMGILRVGPKGGGLRMKHRLLLYDRLQLNHYDA